jgi:hypothetical protein
MAKKPAKKASRFLSPDPSSDRSVKAYPVEEKELEFQQARLKQAAAAGKHALKTAGAMKVAFPANPPTSQSLLPLVPTRSAKRARAYRQPTQSTDFEIVNVSFTLIRPGARQVSLCGEFNAWSPQAGLMTRHEDGNWEAIVALRPGRYEYKFLVDGEWLPDPVVEETVPNGYGSVNSVIEVLELATSHA